MDGVLACVFLAPFRCRSCRARFYRFSTRMRIDFTLVPYGEVRSSGIPRILDVAEEAPPEAPLPQPVEAAPSILIVESDLAIRKLLHRVLGREGYRVHGLANLDKLWPELRSQPVQLLVTDLDVAPQLGLDTIAALRIVYPDLKIIVVSGYWAAEFPQPRGVFESSIVLPKPLRTALLIDTVRQLLGNTTRS